MDNLRAPIPDRGYSGQKQADPGICVLGLLLSTDGGVPLRGHAHPGNLPDVTQLEAMPASSPLACDASARGRCGYGR